MALIKTNKEIEILRNGGRILAEILRMLGAAARPGVSTLDLDAIARAEIKKAGGEPAFPGYRIAHDSPPYPAALCASINDEIVHSIPSRGRRLEAGDIIGLDLGIKFQGLYTDAAITVGVGKVSRAAQKLIDATKTALDRGIAQVKAGNTVGDIASAVQKAGETAGFGIIRDLVGHGVGHAIHEKPYVPNYGRPGSLDRLKSGMVIAIEPMFTAGDYHIRLLDDGWTMVTADGSLAAHFEHTVAVAEAGCIILTE